MSIAIETRVGLFVLASLTLLVGFVLVLGDVRLRPGIEVNADFAYAAGLQVGAPVKVSGIRIGRVSFLRLLEPGDSPPAATSRDELGMTEPAVLRAGLVLDPETRPVLTESARFSVATQGVVGESYLELAPGRRAEASLPGGAAVRGVDAPRLHVMALQLAALVEALDGLATAGAALGPGNNWPALSDLIGSVNGLLADNRQPLGGAIEDLAAAASDLRAVLGRVRAATGPEGAVLSALVADSGATAALLREQLPVLLQQAHELLAALERLQPQVQGALGDGSLQRLLSDAQQVVASAKKLTQDGEKVMARIRRGDGSVGGMVRDPQLYDDLKELLRDLKQHPWKVVWRD